MTLDARQSEEFQRLVATLCDHSLTRAAVERALVVCILTTAVCNPELIDVVLRAMRADGWRDDDSTPKYMRRLVAEFRAVNGD